MSMGQFSMFNKVFVDSDRIHADLMDSLREQTAKRKAFFESPLCERMVADILRVQGQLSCSDAHYALEQTQDRFGWQDLDKATIELFVETLTDGTASPIEFHFPCDEDDEDGSEWACLKRGLYILSISGQGTIYIIRPATETELAEAKDHAE